MSTNSVSESNSDGDSLGPSPAISLAPLETPGLHLANYVRADEFDLAGGC